MRTKGEPIIGYRTMTKAQRYNARMERIWNSCQEAKTRFNLSSRDDDSLDNTICAECGHQSNEGDETHYPECSRIEVE